MFDCCLCDRPAKSAVLIPEEIGARPGGTRVQADGHDGRRAARLQGKRLEDHGGRLPGRGRRRRRIVGAVGRRRPAGRPLAGPLARRFWATYWRSSGDLVAI